MQLSIVVPVYNEEAALMQTFVRLRGVCEQMINLQQYRSVEIVLVNDGSRDQTAKVMNDICKVLMPKNIGIHTLHFSRNFGHSAAVFAGLEKAKGDRVAIIDADLQDPPECLIEMTKKMDSEQADVVYGQRRMRIGESIFKKSTAWIFYRSLNALSGVPIPKDTGDFRLMTREVRDVVVSLSEHEPFLRGLVAWVGFKQLPYLYDRQPRTLGETKYPLRKMIRFATQAIMSFSAMPLKLAAYLGALGIVFSTLLSIHALHVWLTGSALPGWTSLVIAFSFGQSLTLLLIGIVGSYLGRVHMATQNRPRYILRQPRPDQTENCERLQIPS